MEEGARQRARQHPHDARPNHSQACGTAVPTGRRVQKLDAVRAGRPNARPRFPSLSLSNATSASDGKEKKTHPVPGRRAAPAALAHARRLGAGRAGHGHGRGRRGGHGRRRRRRGLCRSRRASARTLGAAVFFFVACVQQAMPSRNHGLRAGVRRPGQPGEGVGIIWETWRACTPLVWECGLCFLAEGAAPRSEECEEGDEFLVGHTATKQTQSGRRAHHATAQCAVAATRTHQRVP